MPLAAPIDYSLGNTPAPESAVQSGLQLGAGIAQRDYALQQQDLQLQQQQAAAQRQAQQRQELAALSEKVRLGKAGANDFGAVVAKYPELKDSFKQSWDALSAEQQQQKINVAAPVFAAAQSGRPDLVLSLLEQNVTALKNSGGNEQDIRAAETWLKMAKEAPEHAQVLGGAFLASVMGDKFEPTFTGLAKAQQEAAMFPSKLTASQEAARKAAADADLSRIKADYGERSEVADLAVKGWNVKKIEQEVIHSKEDSRLRAMEVALKKEDNGLKRQELQLKVDELKEKKAETVRTKVAEINSARSTIDNMLNTADRLLTHPGMNAALGPVDSRAPTMLNDTADFESLAENLNAQAFLSQIPSMKGLGALSNAEGDKLAAGLQSLSLRQSPEQFTTNVKEAQRLILKARANLATKYGVPDTVADTPHALPTDTEVNDILSKYGAKLPPK